MSSTVRPSPPAADVVEQATLGEHERAWDDLVDAAGLPTPFLRSWWLAANATPTSRFVLVVEGDRLLGGAFVDVHRWRGARRVLLDAGGCLAPDHLDLVAADGAQPAVADALAAWLASVGPALVEVRGGHERSGFEALLPGAVRRRVIAPAPFAELPPDAGAYLADRPSWLRNTVKRGRKRLLRDGIDYRCTGPGDDVDRALADLRRLHTERWGTETNLLRGFDRFATAARAGAARGEVSFHELAGPAGVVASLVTFDVAGRWSYYQGGRSTDPAWRSAGTVLMARVLERACESGVREFDFLRGGETYKDAWATGSRDVVRLRTATGGWPAALAAGLAVRDGVRARAKAVVLRRRATRSGD
jgi:CelD/BcsL family acetyltransferase involved in cellulose biosynthesis